MKKREKVYVCERKTEGNMCVKIVNERDGENTLNVYVCVWCVRG